MKEKTIVAARQALVFFRLRIPIIRGTDLRVDKEIPCLENRGSRHGWAGSLSALKEIGCKSVLLVHISPIFRPMEQLLAFKIVKIYPYPLTFSFDSSSPTDCRRNGSVGE
jgi:hypothetical protein